MCGERGKDLPLVQSDPLLQVLAINRALMLSFERITLVHLPNLHCMLMEMNMSLFLSRKKKHCSIQPSALILCLCQLKTQLASQTGNTQEILAVRKTKEGVAFTKPKTIWLLEKLTEYSQSNTGFCEKAVDYWGY
jgi:hypothetical protein